MRGRADGQRRQGATSPGRAFLNADNLGFVASGVECLAKALSSMTRLTSLNLQGKHAFAMAIIMLVHCGVCQPAEWRMLDGG